MPIEHARNAGSLQVLAALLHGVQTVYTCDSNEEPTVFGSLDLRVTQVSRATTFFQQALSSHPMWRGALPVCLAEHHHSKVRCLPPRLSHDYALDQSGNYQPRRRALPAWWYGFA